MSEFRRRLMMQGKDNTAHNLVEYIQANGKSYIELDYIPNDKTRVVISYNRSPGMSGALAYASFSEKESRFMINALNDNFHYVFGDFTGSSPYIGNPWGTHTLDIDLHNDKISVDNNFKILSASFATYKEELKNCTPLCFFFRDDTDTYAKSIKLFSVEIYNENKIIYNLKPFDDGDKNGLVNVLNNKTYTDVNGYLFTSPINT